MNKRWSPMWAHTARMLVMSVTLAGLLLAMAASRPGVARATPALFTSLAYRGIIIM